MVEALDVARLFSLAAKVAVVTGASRGIGFALADGLAAAGATVIAIARSPKPQTPFRNTVHYISADVSGDIGPVFTDIALAHGSIDVLVNAAGISLPPACESEAMLANFEQTLKANLSSPFAPGQSGEEPRDKLLKV
jgi:NAD(P)-dependent dehydrogenase (short-subunit alcohol dehydrogenase family)